MRWLYLDPLNPDELARRASVLKQADRWWRAFTEKRESIESLFRGGSQWDLAGWMEEQLRSIDGRLMWEFGPATRGSGHRLVITPGSETRARPLVRSILERAPRLDGWEFHEYHPAESLETALLTVEGRTGLDIDQWRVTARLASARKLELEFVIGPDAGSEQSVLLAALVASESLLGEQMLDRWIGPIEARPAARRGVFSLLTGSSSRGQRQTVELARLKPMVEALVGQVVDQLPREPCCEMIQDGQWSGFEFSPRPSSDYSGRDDLVVAISARPDVLEATCEGAAFYSTCHSRHGELFCYLKIDGADGLDDSTFADRAEIEDALNAALAPQRSGCVIGGGTGLRYSYIDLALTDPERAIRTIQETLRGGAVPRRAWLLFFDAELADEWVGIYGDTPEPLLAE